MASLDPHRQVLVLEMLATLARVPPSRLYATDAHREAARAIIAHDKARERQREAAAMTRMDIRRQLNAIHNRAQQRRYGRLTTTEERRREQLYARLNEIDGIQP